MTSPFQVVHTFVAQTWLHLDVGVVYVPISPRRFNCKHDHDNMGATFSLPARNQVCSKSLHKTAVVPCHAGTIEQFLHGSNPHVVLFIWRVARRMGRNIPYPYFSISSLPQ